MRSDINVDVFAAECAPVTATDFIDTLLRAGFSPEAYRDAYGDLRDRGMDATEALAHYLRFGIHERRPAPIVLNRDALIDLARLPMRDGDFRARLLTSLLDQVLRDVDHRYGPAIAELWPVIGELAGVCPYIIAGDSHSGHYAMTGWRAGNWLLALHMICHGGSARGLGNQASRSGYGELLRRSVRILTKLPGASEIPFLMQFGQVDIEFVHHFHRVRDGKRKLDLGEYRAFCATTVERYIGFVTDLFDRVQRRNVFLVAVFPPALSDDAWRQGHLNDDIVRRETDISHEALSAGIRLLEIASLRQRTEVHAYFNELLRAACRKHGFWFVDGFSPFLGPDGVVDPRYLIPEANGFDHHLDSRRSYDLLSSLLWEIVERLGHSSQVKQCDPAHIGHD